MAPRLLPLLLVAAAACLSSMAAQARVVRHTFNITNLTVRMLCADRTIVAVNGMLPGPTIDAQEGDTVVVNVFNFSPYNITIHWHGVLQIGTPWADGAAYVTQCPIQPGNSFVQRYRVTGQEGTLWWHAHVSYLRATVYGALIIRPRKGYPFPKPHGEVPIMIGEWWNDNVVEVERQALESGGTPKMSDAFTINGKPGPLYPCSQHDVFKVKVTRGKTYLLRIINAAMNNQHFFMVAGHRFTVVAVDASYTTPYHTDVIAIAPGQTVDALLVADAPPGSYYMAARVYVSSVSSSTFANTTTAGILQYDENRVSPPVLPAFPAFNDSETANRFYTNMTALVLPGKQTVPLTVDVKMFVTFGFGLLPCERKDNNCSAGLFNEMIATDMNNISFVLPSKLSLMEAFFHKVSGVHTRDFPNRPPVAFDYTSPEIAFDRVLLRTGKGTKVKRLRYNATVEMVLQSTSLMGIENHPVHIHGFDFFVVAQGIGNYDPVVAKKKINLVNPLVRNTVAVPAGGWSVIRFRANNPGTWIVHCHLDEHSSTGFDMAFEIQNGPTPATTLPPPPSDLPPC